MKKMLLFAIFGLFCASFASAQQYKRKVFYKILFQNIDTSMVRLENTGSKNNPFNIARFPIYSFPEEENKGGLNVADKEIIYIVNYFPAEHNAYSLKKHQRLPLERLTKDVFRRLKREHGEKVQILKKDIGYAYVLDTEDLLPNGPPKTKKPPPDASTAGTR